IGSPVLKPGGQVSVRAPQSSTIGLCAAAKLEIHTLSLPSTAAAHGPGRPPPVNGEPGYSLPSGRSNDTLPPPLSPLNMARVSTSSPLPPIFSVTSASPVMSAPRKELPRRFVPHTLPRLSIPSPLPLQPVSNVSTLTELDAGNRVTCLPSAF